MAGHFLSFCTQEVSLFYMFSTFETLSLDRTSLHAQPGNLGNVVPCMDAWMQLHCYLVIPYA